MKDERMISDQKYLASHQYQNDSNLNARIALHRRFTIAKQDFREWMFEFIETLPENAHILELGCGPGNLWQDMAAKVPQTWSLVLSDFSPGMVEIAQENLTAAGLKARFEVVDAQEIPFEDESFDCVVANHMIYHIPDRPKALAEMRRVLKPGGKLVAATNGENHMIELRQLVNRLDPSAKMYNAGEVFGLEDGEAQLAPFFSQISLVRHEAGLVVTEAQPLVDYILSIKRSADIIENPQIAYDAIQAVIEAEGAFKIRSDAGVFEAIK